MTHEPRFGVKYPNGTWSGSITASRRDAAHYGKPYHGQVYEVGSADDPAPRHPREAEPWDFADTTPAVRRIERDSDKPRYASAEDEYRPDPPEDIAAVKADIENDLRKCYPEDYGLASKFGGAR